MFHNKFRGAVVFIMLRSEFSCLLTWMYDFQSSLHSSCGMCEILSIQKKQTVENWKNTFILNTPLSLACSSPKGEGESVCRVLFFSLCPINLVLTCWLMKVAVLQSLCCSEAFRGFSCTSASSWHPEPRLCQVRAPAWRVSWCWRPSCYHPLCPSAEEEGGMYPRSI